MTLHPDDRLIIRSMSHIVLADQIRPDAMFSPKVTPLIVARIMMQIERGERLYRDDRGTWYAPEGSRLRQLAFLNLAVREMIRTGLIHHLKYQEGPQTVVDALIPADVHLYFDPSASGVLCGAQAAGVRRLRVTDESDAVDCRRCVDLS